MEDSMLLLLLLLNRSSRVQLCVTPQTAAHQAPPSLGFSRQEYWSGLPFPSLVHESESEVAQSCPTLSDPKDCSLSGSSVRGIFQARVLEWVAIAFSRKTVWRFLKKLGIKPPYDPAIPFLGIYPKETKIEKDTCIPLFIATLFTIAN